MTITGTCYFVDKPAAIRYFRPYADKQARGLVEEKLAEGLIKIGKPETNPGEKLIVIDNGTRYAIEQA